MTYGEETTETTAELVDTGLQAVEDVIQCFHHLSARVVWPAEVLKADFQHRLARLDAFLAKARGIEEAEAAAKAAEHVDAEANPPGN
jgi:hypothetical protein